MQTLFCCILLLPSFCFVFCFLFFEELVFFFSAAFFFFFPLTNPFVQDLKLSDFLLIFVLLLGLSFLLDLIITSYQCIGQNSSEKLKQKETVQTSKTGHGSQNRTVGSWSMRVPVFLHGTVLHPKQTIKLKGSRFSQSVRSGVQNLAHTLNYQK